MKHLTILALAAVLLASCSDDDPVVLTDKPGEVVESPELSNPSEYHEKYRTVAYPRTGNEIYINPCPLLVPESMKTAEYLQFELSQSESFAPEATIQSGLVPWHMYNPHRALETGKWYWRVRNVDAAGTEGPWSEVYDFEIKGDEQVFVTPEFKEFDRGLPQQLPRMCCYVDGLIGNARKHVTEHPEYAKLVSRTNNSFSTEWNTWLPGNYSNYSKLYEDVTCLYAAWMLTQDSKYADRMIYILDAMIAHPASNSVMFYGEDFVGANILWAHAAIYDAVYDRLTPSQRSYVESFVNRALGVFYRKATGANTEHPEECMIYDNHFWQINGRLYLQAGMTMYNNANVPYANRMVEYIYELWTSRAPASGWNRDGMWHNGTGYFQTNVKTLCEVPTIFSYVTRFNFMKHPFYSNTGRALTYNYTPGRDNLGFGDGAERESNRVAPRSIAAYADWVARENGDGYAAWFASQDPDLVRDDWNMRLYRMCQTDTYQNGLPDDVPMLAWYKDIGEVGMHTNLLEGGEDLAVGFRSSPYGSGSHTSSSQNAFNITYGGRTVYRSAGYYTGFSDRHNLLFYRHTRGQNSVLVNGIGQPYTTSAYGRILRAGSGATIAYALGDASNAYCGISDDPMWINNFARAGVEQTPENGFGETPLTKYYRHVALLKPGVLVIYDELEASEAARWDWLLHSNDQLTIDEDGTVYSKNVANGIHSRATIIGSVKPEMSVTDEWYEPPTGSYAKQWHLTATVKDAPATRFLTIVQPCNITDEIPLIEQDGDAYVIGNWRISAALDPSSPASLTIVNTKTGAALDMSPATQVTVGDKTYYRGYTRSTLLIDRQSDGSATAELTDEEPGMTRAR